MAAEWGAVVPQWLGIFGLAVQLFVAIAFKIATGEYATEPALLTAFGGLVIAGQGAELIAATKAPRDDDEDGNQ